MQLHWMAHYDDGSFYSQLDNGKYYHIDRDNLKAFDVWMENRLLIRLDTEADSKGKKRFFWRKRHRMTTTGIKQYVYLCGWEQDGHYHTCYAFEDGSVIMGGQWRNDMPFMQEIVWLDFE